MFFLACMVVLAVGCLAMLGYAFAMYSLGRWVAAHVRLPVNPILGTVFLAFAWLPIALPSLWLPIGPIMQLAVAICLYALHAQPCCVGYWAGRTLERMQAEARWKKNADDWLANWECQEYVE